jgi:outer membrane protein assembly factor BamD (BamD/ComL family)
MPAMSPNRNAFFRLHIAAAMSAAAALCMLASPALAQAGGEHTSERYVLDPTTGQIEEIPPPVPGTDVGDLHLAQQALTAGKANGARKMLEAWMERYPDSPMRGEALLALGDAEFACQNYFEAYDRYRELLDTYPTPDLTEQSFDRQINLAVTLLGTEDAKPKKRKLWKIFRIHAFEEALEILLDVEARAGKSEWAEKALRTRAEYHYRVGEFEEAEEAYARLAREYPRGGHTPEALLNSAWSAFASFPGIPFDDAKLIEAEERFLELQRVYPNYAAEQDVTAVLDRIRDTRAHKHFSRAQYYERVHQPRAAGFYYRLILDHWPNSTWAVQAQARLQRLGYETEPLTPVEPAPATAPAEDAS